MKKSLPKNRDNDYRKDIVEARLQYLEQTANVNLNPIRNNDIDTEIAKGNIENMIGFIQVPVGVIGPLRVNGEHASGEFYVPLSTLEGALISSYQRGARVISLSGGCDVVTLQDTIQRAPFFVFENIKMSKEFIIWFRVNFSKIKEVSSTTTKFGKLHSYKTFLFGRVVYVRLEFSSGDAMGMNMVTRATGEICNYVKNNYEIVRYVIESNLSVDKKPSYMNMIMGRGKSISAEVRIPSAIVRRFLLTTPSKIVEDLHIGTLGSILSGTIGANYHFANGIAALFLACGQDVANVSESCAGILNMEVIEHDLYVSIFLPSLIVATIGGGTGLPSQNACLAMLGCCGMNKVKKFAEIAAATILAGEISLAAAITAGDFIDAHEKYGRNRPAGDQSRMK